MMDTGRYAFMNCTEGRRAGHARVVGHSVTEFERWRAPHLHLHRLAHG